MSSSLASIYAATEQTRELPMPAWVFGLVAFIGFLVLLGALWSFRGVGQKVALGSAAHGAGAHGAGTHGAGTHGAEGGHH